VEFTRSDEAAIGKVEGIGDELLFDRFMNRQIARNPSLQTARFCLTKLLGRENACNQRAHRELTCGQCLLESLPIGASSNLFGMCMSSYFAICKICFGKAAVRNAYGAPFLRPFLGTASTTYRDATAHDVPYPELICQAMMFLA
jgi:hypothetical protein